MKIKIRGLNDNETYCCSPDELKALFKGENIDMYFGLQISRNPLKNSTHYRVSKKSNNIVILNICSFKAFEGEGWLVTPIANFFILHKDIYTNEMREEFRMSILPAMKRFYGEHKNDVYNNDNGAAKMVISMNSNDEFIIEYTKKYF